MSGLVVLPLRAKHYWEFNMLQTLHQDGLSRERILQPTSKFDGTLFYQKKNKFLIRDDAYWEGEVDGTPGYFVNYQEHYRRMWKTKTPPYPGVVFDENKTLQDYGCVKCLTTTETWCERCMVCKECCVDPEPDREERDICCYGIIGQRCHQCEWLMSSICRTCHLCETCHHQEAPANVCKQCKSCGSLCPVCGYCNNCHFSCFCCGKMEYQSPFCNQHCPQTYQRLRRVKKEILTLALVGVGGGKTRKTRKRAKVVDEEQPMMTYFSLLSEELIGCIGSFLLLN